jgi:hypothetical protein
MVKSAARITTLPARVGSLGSPLPRVKPLSLLAQHVTTKGFVALNLSFGDFRRGRREIDALGAAGGHRNVLIGSMTITLGN